MTAVQQSALKTEQIEEFYHDAFVKSQVEDFTDIIGEYKLPIKKVLDIGGGCGFFANALAQQLELHTKVIDTDAASVAACAEIGVPAEIGDALNPAQRGDEDIVCFNLILHHLVASSDVATAALQKRALDVWMDKAEALFINEYIYDSYIKNASGWLIYRITSSKVLSALCQVVAQFVPSLRANTFGTGVRFRADREWVNMFDKWGFRIAAHRRGREEYVSLPRRMLLIKSCRRDSYLLVPKLKMEAV